MRHWLLTSNENKDSDAELTTDHNPTPKAVAGIASADGYVDDVEEYAECSSNDEKDSNDS